MKDDDDYKQLPDWARNSFWITKLPGTDQFVYIPKPFEIGALGSVVERGTELAFGGDDFRLGDFGRTVGAILAEQLSMNPVPQLVKPAMEAAFNYDSFRERDIDSVGQQRLPAGDRFTASTSAGAVALGRTLCLAAACRASGARVLRLVGNAGAERVGLPGAAAVGPAREPAPRPGPDRQLVHRRRLRERSGSAQQQIHPALLRPAARGEPGLCRLFPGARAGRPGPSARAGRRRSPARARFVQGRRQPAARREPEDQGVGARGHTDRRSARSWTCCIARAIAWRPWPTSTPARGPDAKA